MYLQTYIHTLHVWIAWLKVHRQHVLGGVFAVLACVHTVMASDQLTNAYVLLHFKETNSVVLYACEHCREPAVVAMESASSVPAIEAEELRPAAPVEQSSSLQEASSSASSEEVISASSAPVSSSSSSAASLRAEPDFPSFGNAIMPVSKVPNWGAMTTPDEWNRTYAEMGAADFVALPRYDISELTSRTMDDLKQERHAPESIRLLTEKLAYSTRFFGAYDLDAGEFSAIHPGMDIKLAEGTPVGAVAGGKVHAVIHKGSGLGLHAIIEHRVDGKRFFSIYGHLGSVAVNEGDVVTPGKTIGYVGMTGKTTAPHLHLQIDVGGDGETHTPYWPDHVPGRSEAARFTVNPAVFVSRY